MPEKLQKLIITHFLTRDYEILKTGYMKKY